MSKVFTITEGLENLGALRTGGQGSVYKGRRMGPVLSAVKLLPTPIHSENEDDKNYRNFTNEVAKLQKVNEQPNPHVVKMLSSGITESGSLPFIEMEYIEGPDLCELLQPPHEKIFTLQEIIRVAYQLANALAHCHKVGVKHGDVKSNNVKYNVHTGNYVLLDFGLAIMSEEQRRTSMRHAGAIEFMAPEQYEGRMLTQTDVYSFGIVLYELLTGQVPFPLEGHNETGRNSVMLSHIEAPVPDPVAARAAAAAQSSWLPEKQEIEKRIPLWLLQVISKCLQKKPEDRYATGTELHEAIVNGTLIGSKGEPDILLSENERLQEQIKQLKQDEAEREKHMASLRSIAIAAGARYNAAKGTYERNPGVSSVSRKAFIGVLTAALVFAGLFCYSFFTHNNSNSGGAIYPASGAYMKPPVIYPYINRDDSIINAIVAAEVRKIIAKQKKKAAVVKAPVTTVTPVGPPPKKKRKKFLGIF